jgi:hypothetical protein
LGVRGYVFDSISDLSGFIGPHFTTNEELNTSTIKEVDEQAEGYKMSISKWLLALEELIGKLRRYPKYAH